MKDLRNLTDNEAMWLYIALALLIVNALTS